MRTHRIAAMGGDGIGPEVVAAGVQALKACAERDGQFKISIGVQITTRSTAS
jgi:tartrate dehydrogenase/decarboxylase/D-malate dehydrogenase